MTPVIFWALLALTLAVGVGIGIGRFSAADSANPQDATPAAVMQDELREALDRDELVLAAPQRGLLMPSEFLPVASQHSELMGSLTSWVLRRALADYKAWTAVGRDWTVAVNISAADFGSLEFARSVGQILAEAGIRPDLLHIEVAETELAFDTDLARQVVGALTAQCILMSIDDFGIGDTSLSQLRTLQVSEVKIPVPGPRLPKYSTPRPQRPNNRNDRLRRHCNEELTGAGRAHERIEMNRLTQLFDSVPQLRRERRCLR